MRVLVVILQQFVLSYVLMSDFRCLISLLIQLNQRSYDNQSTLCCLKVSLVLRAYQFVYEALSPFGQVNVTN
jgi:hypothetical protein